MSLIDAEEHKWYCYRCDRVWLGKVGRWQDEDREKQLLDQWINVRSLPQRYKDLQLLCKSCCKQMTLLDEESGKWYCQRDNEIAFDRDHALLQQDRARLMKLREERRNLDSNGLEEAVRRFTANMIALKAPFDKIEEKITAAKVDNLSPPATCMNLERLQSASIPRSRPTGEAALVGFLVGGVVGAAVGAAIAGERESAAPALLPLVGPLMPIQQQQLQQAMMEKERRKVEELARQQALITPPAPWLSSNCPLCDKAMIDQGTRLYCIRDDVLIHKATGFRVHGSKVAGWERFIDDPVEGVKGGHLMSLGRDRLVVTDYDGETRWVINLMDIQTLSVIIGKRETLHMATQNGTFRLRPTVAATIWKDYVEQRRRELEEASRTRMYG